MDDAGEPVWNYQHRRQRVHRAQGSEQANGLNAHNNRSGVVFNIYGNTFVSKANASNNVLNLSGSGTANLRNNIFHTVNQTALRSSMALTRANNLWYGNNIQSCQASEICGQDPQFVSYANNQFGLASGSPAIASGLNLGSSYATFVMPGANWPNPALAMRPAGAWDIGAPLRAPCVSFSAAGRRAYRALRREGWRTVLTSPPGPGAVRRVR